MTQVRATTQHSPRHRDLILLIRTMYGSCARLNFPKVSVSIFSEVEASKDSIVVNHSGSSMAVSTNTEFVMLSNNSKVGIEENIGMQHISSSLSIKRENMEGEFRDKLVPLARDVHSAHYDLDKA